jgi:hypothetical protein
MHRVTDGASEQHSEASLAPGDIRRLDPHVSAWLGVPVQPHQLNEQQNLTANIHPISPTEPQPTSTLNIHQVSATEPHDQHPPGTSNVAPRKWVARSPLGWWRVESQHPYKKASNSASPSSISQCNNITQVPKQRHLPNQHDAGQI